MKILNKKSSYSLDIKKTKLCNIYKIDFGWPIGIVEISFCRYIHRNIPFDWSTNEIILKQDKTTVILKVTDVTLDVHQDNHSLDERFSILHDQRFLLGDMPEDERLLLTDTSIYLDDNIYSERDKLNLLWYGI